jgi:hypothetical protein
LANRCEPQWQADLIGIHFHVGDMPSPIKGRLPYQLNVEMFARMYASFFNAKSVIGNLTYTVMPRDIRKGKQRLMQSLNHQEIEWPLGSFAVQSGAGSNFSVPVRDKKIAGATVGSDLVQIKNFSFKFKEKSLNAN